MMKTNNLRIASACDEAGEVCQLVDGPLIREGAKPARNPIADAIRLLTEAADEYRRGISIGDVPDWAGEPETKTAYDETMAVVAGLRGHVADYEAQHQARQKLDTKAAEIAALREALNAFEQKTRGIPQAHMAARLVAELRYVMAQAVQPTLSAYGGPEMQALILDKLTVDIAQVVQPERIDETNLLLKQAMKQLEKWSETYGQWQPEWLAPAGDVELLEDIAEHLGLPI